MDNHSELFLRELAKLSALLKISKDRFRSDADDHGRSAAHDAVAAVVQFISEVLPGGAELALPFHQLLYALEDLDAGQVAPLLRRAEIFSRPTDPLAMRLFQAMAATLMELHLRTGLSRKEAAGVAARDLNRCGYRDAKRRTITRIKVMSWRDKLSTARGTNDLAAQRYHACLTWLKARFPDQPQEAAAFFLKVLPGVVPPATAGSASINVKRP